MLMLSEDTGSFWEHQSEYILQKTSGRKKRYSPLLAQPRFNRTLRHFLKRQQASWMLLAYKFARHFLPGFHSDNDKHSVKLVTCWGNINKANDISKKHAGGTPFAQVLISQTFGPK